MTDINTVVHGYIASWNETSPDRRRELIAEAFADDATYLAPILSGDGHDGTDAMIAGAQSQFPPPVRAHGGARRPP